MSRRRLLKPAGALIVAAMITAIIAGCAFYKQGSLTLSQPQGIGAVRVHFALCQPAETGCGKNTETSTIQYLIGIAVPPGSTPPQTITATSTVGGAPIVFTRNEEVAPQMAASSAAMQKLISEASPKEQEEAAKFKPVIGGPWPPVGLQGVGYVSPPVAEVSGATVEWNVDADFSLPAGQGGQPFPGPFGTALALGARSIKGGSAGGPISCIKITAKVEAKEGEFFCSGAIAESQLGTADLTIAAPPKPPKAFVGGSAKLAYGLRYGGSGSSITSFGLSATTSAKGAKAKVARSTFTPGAPSSTTHLSPIGTGKVIVTVPRRLKPGSYKATLRATAPLGGSVSQVATFRVVKAKIKLGAARPNSTKGTATLAVKIPSAGKLTIAGKAVATTSKKSKKAKTLKMTIAATGPAAAELRSSGSVKLKVKATFKPSSGIPVSKTKSIVLQLH